VVFAQDCIGEEARRVVAALRPGQVALLENLRFHKEEEANFPDFARALADLGDVYVDDAFSAAHRAHASIDVLARLLPSAAGKLMQAELTALTGALEKPARPVLALIGGAKGAARIEAGIAARTVGIEAVPNDMMILDIGPVTATRIVTALEEARTLVWNGPLAHLIHQEAEGEWQSFRNSRQRSCALRLFHRWDLVSGAGAGGFGTVLAGR
jgi:3-phosphoglycerate kinase